MADSFRIKGIQSLTTVLNAESIYHVEGVVRVRETSCIGYKGKGKVIPLQARCGSENV